MLDGLRRVRLMLDTADLPPVRSSARTERHRRDQVRACGVERGGTALSGRPGGARGWPARHRGGDATWSQSADRAYVAAAVPRVGDSGIGRPLPATAAVCAPDLGGDGAHGV